MKKRLTEYLNRMDELLNSGSENPEQEASSYDALCKQHLIQIQFFQHERLIHLIVTCLFAILSFFVFITLLFSFTPELLLLFAALLALLIPYIGHYYFLENGVQKLYAQYDRLYERASEFPMN